MVYVIKFIYSTFILPPGCFILLFVLTGILTVKKSKKAGALILAVSMLFYISSTAVFGEGLIKSLEHKYMPPSDITGDVIVILGGGAYSDTPGINGPGSISGYAANRVLTGIALYNKLHCPIIVSGGKVFKGTGEEALITKKILMNAGIPEDKIMTDTESINTSQNASYSKKIISENGFNNPLLVTSAFHMPRAVKDFKKQGVDVTPYPADYTCSFNKSISLWDFVPTTDALTKTAMSVKEYLGMLK